MRSTRVEVVDPEVPVPLTRKTKDKPKGTGFLSRIKATYRQMRRRAGRCMHTGEHLLPFEPAPEEFVDET
jgi:hypothetical protein